MPQITSYSDANATRRQREIPGGHHSWRTDFMKPPAGVDEAPTAFLSESTAGRVIRTHYHALDQFHIIVKGGGTLGKHELGHYVVHFARAYTPYGPMVANEKGLGFISLYPRRDSGAHYLPECVEELMATEERKPWQISEMPAFDGTAENYEHKFARIHNDEGLAAYSIGLKPHAHTTAPDASMTDGQFILVTKGSLLYASKVYEPLSLIFVKPDEPRFRLIAGAEGMEALALHFPSQRNKPSAAKPVADAPAAYRVWQCALCAFVYDEAIGIPDEGIAPGTRWEDVPDDWTCPDCAAGKADFQMFVRD